LCVWTRQNGTKKTERQKLLSLRQNRKVFCLVKIDIKLLINKEINTQQDKRQFFQEYNVPPENNIFFLCGAGSLPVVRFLFVFCWYRVQRVQVIPTAIPT
jgi:hypothetical protein